MASLHLRGTDALERRRLAEQSIFRRSLSLADLRTPAKNAQELPERPSSAAPPHLSAHVSATSSQIVPPARPPGTDSDMLRVDLPVRPSSAAPPRLGKKVDVLARPSSAVAPRCGTSASFASLSAGPSLVEDGHGRSISCGDGSQRRAQRREGSENNKRAAQLWAHARLVVRGMSTQTRQQALASIAPPHMLAAAATFDTRHRVNRARAHRALHVAAENSDSAGACGAQYVFERRVFKTYSHRFITPPRPELCPIEARRAAYAKEGSWKAHLRARRAARDSNDGSTGGEWHGAQGSGVGRWHGVQGRGGGAGAAAGVAAGAAAGVATGAATGTGTSTGAIDDDNDGYPPLECPACDGCCECKGGSCKYCEGRGVLAHRRGPSPRDLEGLERRGFDPRGVHSIWLPRIEWSDSKSLFDTDACERKRFMVDWGAVLGLGLATS